MTISVFKITHNQIQNYLFDMIGLLNNAYVGFCIKQ